ncbi:secreted pili protein involved in motility and biofilm formation [Caballeronia peredens]|nr:secreted pili protein involved in motility and biofilm formation [Caballeronia peredens]
MMKRFRAVIFLVAFLMCGLASQSAHAQLCVASSTGLNFGSFSPVTSTPTAVGTIAITCTALLAKLRVCVSIGPGVGQTSYAPRNMTSGANTLQYNIYTDSAGTNVVGSTLGSSGYAAAAFDLPVSLGSVNTTITLYGKIMPSQTTPVAGAYSASFGSTAVIGYQTLGTTGTFLDCLALPLLSPAFAFPVTASVVNDCTISAANISFGSAGLLKSTLKVAGGVTVACTNAGAYSIALSSGNGVNATAATRYMTRSSGGETVAYGLYTTSSYGVPWGDGSAGSATVSGTGTGASQTTPVYARVLPQATPSPGNYSDTIIATVSF